MTVVFVTHSIPEAVYLSNRVVVLSPRPGRLAEIIDINLPAKRSPEILDTDDFFHYQSRLRGALREGVGA
jgi:NitT/TauT family transport system ATP-binding protein